jgi:hypothetical protein
MDKHDGSVYCGCLEKVCVNVGTLLHFFIVFVENTVNKKQWEVC